NSRTMNRENWRAVCHESGTYGSGRGGWKRTARQRASRLLHFENLKIANMIRNHHLAKSINDAAWGRFLTWVQYYASLHAIPVIKVVPHFTSQNCSGCGTLVKKSLSVRTHICPACGLIMDRDHNAARNILAKALSTVGQTATDVPASA
ncbi:RNA-guided endonuclease InsQ/TnpB family protein, partial [Dictyobacter arantiisoli]|uniref:RNA-guided endonuclease InsQ/TnpB family protein n=1 Tax=Dictyobacter arantiisoli TaxID=2014874 RepID=UPI001F22A2E8